MNRRHFLTSVGAAAWPVVARAQPAKMPVIGILGSTNSAGWLNRLNAVRQGFGDAGYVEGRNVAIEYRWAESQIDRLPSLAADLANREVAAIVTIGGSVAALAAKAVTTTIPVLFVIGADPVKLGIVESLNRPGANVTGISFLLNELVAKRLEVIRELLPTANNVGLLVNPRNPNAASDTQNVQAAARALGMDTHIVNASSEGEFGPAFASLVNQKVTALLVLPDPFFIGQSTSIVTLAAQYTLPANYPLREDVVSGGLISYGPSITDAHRKLGGYVGRILAGTKPADLPVQQSTKIELVINLKTAKALGLSVPPQLLARADEVIE